LVKKLRILELFIKEQASVTLNCVIMKYCDSVGFVTYFFCFLFLLLTSVFWDKARQGFGSEPF